MAKETEIMYMVGSIKKDIGINLFGIEHTIPLQWADGMIGALPVFDSPESAEKYADGKCGITVMKSKDED